jgi:hypothetical protein
MQGVSTETGLPPDRDKDNDGKGISKILRYCGANELTEGHPTHGNQLNQSNQLNQLNHDFLTYINALHPDMP